jgi:hypothetical protein
VGTGTSYRFLLHDVEGGRVIAIGNEGVTMVGAVRRL